VLGWLPRCSRPVVTSRAASLLDLHMRKARAGKGRGVMTRLTWLGGRHVLSWHDLCRHGRAHGVASRAACRSSLEYAANVTALATDILVRPGERKTSSDVIEPTSSLSLGKHRLCRPYGQEDEQQREKTGPIHSEAACPLTLPTIG